MELGNKFIQSFYQQLKKELNKLQNYRLKPKNYIPEILTEEYGVEVIYSLKKGHVMFVFNDYNVGKITHRFVTRDVIDAFDITGKWLGDNVQTGIVINNGLDIKLKRVIFDGIKPFSLIGNKIELFMDSIDFSLPIGVRRNIKYAMVFSIPVLIEHILNIDEFTDNFVFAYWDYYSRYKEKLDSTSDKYDEYVSKLEKIKHEMNYYFYDEQVLERDIEYFIKENSIIISQVLGLDKPIFQAELKDVIGKYGQTLKPDLMGFDAVRDNWTIVDYKLGRGANLIQSPGGVRVKFYDSVAKLEAQLRIYRKYFNEEDHRRYFSEKYNTKIQEFPETIGIIGYIDNESRKDFNELLDEKQRWFNLIPYNDLQTRFEKLISTIKSIN